MGRPMYRLHEPEYIIKPRRYQSRSPEPGYRDQRRQAGGKGQTGSDHSIMAAGLAWPSLHIDLHRRNLKKDENYRTG